MQSQNNPKRIIVSVTTLLLVVFVLNFESVAQGKLSISGWLISPIQINNGEEFDGCAIWKQYSGGYALGFRLNPEKEISIFLAHANWSMPVNATYIVDVIIDRGNPTEAIATVTGENTVEIAFDKPGDVLDLITKASDLIIVTTPDAHRFDIDGMKAPLQATNDCVNGYTQQALLDQPSIRVDVEAGIVPFIQELVSQPEMLLFSIVDDQQDLLDRMGADVFWKGLGVAGLGMAVAEEEFNIDLDMTVSVETFRSGCEGEFSMSPPEKRQFPVGGIYLSYGILCEDGNDSTAYRFSYMPVKNEVFIFTHMGTDDVESLKLADEFLFRTISKWLIEGNRN